MTINSMTRNSALPSGARYPDLAGKVFIITGASSGIGAATARQLAAQGARVALAARRADACAALLDDIRAAGGEGLVVPTDVAQDAEVARLVAATLDAFGRLDGAFNNAGALGTAGPADRMGDDVYDAIFDVNVRGAFHCLRHQVPAIRASAGGGSIVFNASMAGVVGFANVAAYTASKHALVGLTRSAALELGADGIRVNAVCPGFVDTAMSDQLFATRDDKMAFVTDSPAGRWGSPDEIAAMTCFLLSDVSSFVNGQPMLVDGAYTAR
ncbi:SDR family NAD(P)-dependent oxidoreductase [Azospirillum griseum]